jgi:quercetin dioxygenase-like cupin family protein
VEQHVGAATGERWCEVEHVGLVLSGRAMAAMRDGTERVMEPGQFFYVPAGHDSWVVGDEPYVSLHIMGSEDYAVSEPVDLSMIPCRPPRPAPSAP